jgi:hypothetical protein
MLKMLNCIIKHFTTNFLTIQNKIIELINSNVTIITIRINIVLGVKNIINFTILDDDDNDDNEIF